MFASYTMMVRSFTCLTKSYSLTDLTYSNLHIASEIVSLFLLVLVELVLFSTETVLAPLIFPSDVRQEDCTLSVLEFLGLSLFCTPEVDGLNSRILGDITSLSCSNFETSKCSYDKGGRLPMSLATYTGIRVVSNSSIIRRIFCIVDTFLC